jgi:hypothetical protein
MRLLFPEVRAGGETARDDAFVTGGFCFNSPSGIISSFSVAEHLKNVPHILH